MKDQTKTPGATVLVPRNLPEKLVSSVYFQWEGRVDTLWPELLEAAEKAGLSDPAEQTPAVGGDLSKDHVFRELVNSLRDVAKQYGSTEQLRERISTVLRGHVAPLLTEIQRSRVLLGGSYSAGVAMSKEIDQLKARIHELEEQHCEPAVYVDSSCLRNLKMSGFESYSALLHRDQADITSPQRVSLYRQARPATAKVDERSEFEAWHTVRYPLHPMLLSFNEEKGEYSYPSRREMFDVWHARAKLNGVNP